VTNLAEALSNLDEDKVYKLVDEKIMEGEPPINIIEECSAGVTVVGERFAKGEYYLTELMFSAEILQQVMKKLKLDKQERSNSLGTVVIGTVKDDIHDIGKNIVVSMLRSNGFKVIDLGVDVGAKIEIFKIINSMVEKKNAVIIISSEMTEIIGLCDRAIVIREGRSVGELQKHELSELNLIKYSMGVNEDAS
jgi:methanogenic corrinoid protein MtbC1